MPAHRPASIALVALLAACNSTRDRDQASASSTEESEPPPSPPHIVRLEVEPGLAESSTAVVRKRLAAAYVAGTVRSVSASEIEVSMKLSMPGERARRAGALEPAEQARWLARELLTPTGRIELHLARSPESLQSVLPPGMTPRTDEVGVVRSLEADDRNEIEESLSMLSSHLSDDARLWVIERPGETGRPRRALA